MPVVGWGIEPDRLKVQMCEVKCGKGLRILAMGGKFLRTGQKTW